jgi:MFS transporter, DHA3 family, macrolide efflux protein
MIGSDTGFLVAGQAAAVLFLSLVGGIWADHWDPRRTMISVDVIRGLIVLVPVGWVYFHSSGYGMDHGVPLGVLIGVALSVSAFSAFFDPAIQAVIPKLVHDPELLQATNGLMGTTSRLARAVGPGVVALLTGFIPMIHFFTLDSLSFAVSAIALWSLAKELPKDQAVTRPRQGIVAGLKSGFVLIDKKLPGISPVRFVMFAKGITTGCWALILPLGIALMVQKMLPGNIRAYGFLLASYGVGNLGGALVLSNLRIERPMRVLGWGFIVMGVGFSTMAAIPGWRLQLPLMMVFNAVAAIGGPMNDLAHVDVLQKRFAIRELVRVTRLRMAMEFGGMLIFLIAAPLLFQLLSPQWVVGLAGLIIFIVGVVGLVTYGETR